MSALESSLPGGGGVLLFKLVTLFKNELFGAYGLANCAIEYSGTEGETLAFTILWWCAIAFKWTFQVATLSELGSAA